ncbi:MAG TPA: hypothetical protein VGG74_17115 [Kofleriaceae bacterium]|jgi:hypothetical protein
MRAAICVTFAIVAVSATAHAYPQFQLSKDQTCSDCHLSPGGGGLLSENGLNVAQAMSVVGEDPGPFYGKITPPSWLAFGGDILGAAGYDYIGPGNPDNSAVLFPMQAELYAAATVQNFSLHVTAGARDPNYDNSDTLFASREHWLQWQQNAGDPDGLFIRVGRFEPVFGLRLAEHVDYNQRYGGEELYGEAYGAAIEYISQRFEVHATGFVHDPWQGTTELGDGGTVYAELRLQPTTSIGIEGKFDKTTDDRKLYGGITAKQYFATPGILLQLESELIHQNVIADDHYNGYDDQFVAYVLGSYFLPKGFMIDLGFGDYDPNVSLRNLSQEVFDLNIHWFATSHIELALDSRLQSYEFGGGGETNGYSLLLLHYRI